MKYDYDSITAGADLIFFTHKNLAKWKNYSVNKSYSISILSDVVNYEGVVLTSYSSGNSRVLIIPNKEWSVEYILGMKPSFKEMVVNGINDENIAKLYYVGGFFRKEHNNTNYLAVTLTRKIPKNGHATMRPRLHKDIY